MSVRCRSDAYLPQESLKYIAGSGQVVWLYYPHGLFGPGQLSDFHHPFVLYYTSLSYFITRRTNMNTDAGASSASPQPRGRGRGKSRGGLGKYLRARGRGHRGGGRPAEFRQRLVLEDEELIEFDPESEEAKENQRKFSKRQLASNADRYKEPEPVLNSDGTQWSFDLLVSCVYTLYFL